MTKKKLWVGLDTDVQYFVHWFAHKSTRLAYTVPNHLAHLPVSLWLCMTCMFSTNVVMFTEYDL